MKPATEEMTVRNTTQNLCALACILARNSGTKLIGAGLVNGSDLFPKEGKFRDKVYLGFIGSPGEMATLNRAVHTLYQNNFGTPPAFEELTIGRGINESQTALWVDVTPYLENPAHLKDAAHRESRRTAIKTVAIGATITTAGMAMDADALIFASRRNQPWPATLVETVLGVLTSAAGTRIIRTGINQLDPQTYRPNTESMHPLGFIISLEKKIGLFYEKQGLDTCRKLGVSLAQPEQKSP